MKHNLLYILFGIITLSCSPEKKKPTPFLDHQQMVDLAVEISLAEGTKMSVDKQNTLPVKDYYSLIFDKYNITSVELDSINSWYMYNLDEYNDIFKEALDILNILHAEEKNKIKKNNSKR